LRGQTKREKLVLQEWGFCGWVGNPPKENKVFIGKDAQAGSNQFMIMQLVLFFTRLNFVYDLKHSFLFKILALQTKWAFGKNNVCRNPKILNASHKNRSMFKLL